MNYQDWQKKRRELSEREISERSGNLESARAPLQVAITEQAIRELFDKFEGMRAVIGALSERLNVLEQKRGPGRPPNEAK